MSNFFIKRQDNDVKQSITQKSGYTRPDKTFTDNLSKEDIEKRLEDYEKVTDLYKVPLGVHMRYFTKDKKTGEQVFRMGGQLHHNKGLPEYVMLSNGTTQWSVQVKDSIFFRKLTLEEIKEALKNEITILKEKNEKLKNEIKKLKGIDAVKQTKNKK